MRRARGFAAGLLLGALIAAAPTGASACIWDRDTVAMERLRFPGALDLITGHFVHHGREFYEWRIEDRTSRLEARPDDLRLLDDLAAAYDKTGEHNAAIETMERARALDPDRYETQANLGTFHAHAGHFEQALVHIDRALQINPQAHFGRERYQALLIRYLQERGGASELPLSDHGGFADYVFKHEKAEGIAEQQAAVKGVLGMMHFGKHDSPILLEALANLLETGALYDDAAQLAARAYLRASQIVEDPAVRRAYRERAKGALSQSEGVTFRQVESALGWELDRAEAFVGKMRDDESDFLGADDPEAAFDAAYFDGMDLSPPDPLLDIESGAAWFGVAAGGLAGLAVLLWGIAAVRQRRRGF